MKGRGERSVVVISPPTRWAALNLQEFIEYGDLLRVLIWRDVKIRYKQTAIGAAWAVIQPLFAMVVFSLFFGYLAKIPSGGVPYPIFAFVALLPWQFFSKALSEASTSLVQNERIIGKMYMPRLLIPSAVVLAGLLDLAIAFIVLIGMMVFYGITPTPAVTAIPLLIAVMVATALGVSYWLSALDVEYRDVRYVLPFLTQIWLFATPIVYPSSLVPKAWRGVYGANPLVGVVEGFRWALLGIDPPSSMTLVASLTTAALLFLSGLVYFRRVEGTLADRL